MILADQAQRDAVRRVIDESQVDVWVWDSLSAFTHGDEDRANRRALYNEVIAPVKSEYKMAVFLIRTGELGRHPLLSAETDPLDPAHAGLTAGDVDLILTLANLKRCSEKMPTILITVDQVDLTPSAWLGQLWADLTLVYARLIGVDPGSNPEVKAVRTRASAWLADKAAAASLLAEGGEVG